VLVHWIQGTITNGFIVFIKSDEYVIVHCICHEKGIKIYYKKDRNYDYLNNKCTGCRQLFPDEVMDKIEPVLRTWKLQKKLNV